MLEVTDLSIHFETSTGPSTPVDGVSFRVNRGETLGIVGESGSGKSMTSLGVLRLVPSPGKIVSGRVVLDGRDLMQLSEQQMRELRGGEISMILQDPMTALNPVFSIGYQVGETLEIHQKLRGPSLRARIIELLNLVRIPAAERRLADYPHQMSGGMRQRVAGAIGLASTPKVLICDEPTTALDVTIQAQYLELLKDVQDRTGIAIVFITHDMSVVAAMCDRVAVMYAGRVVETGRTRDVFSDPAHPYTIALLRCVPRLEGVERLESIDGQPPDPRNFPPGCRFAPRCPKAQPICTERYPDVLHLKDDHAAACHFPGDWNHDDSA